MRCMRPGFWDEALSYAEVQTVEMGPILDQSLDRIQSGGRVGGIDLEGELLPCLRHR